MEWSCASCRREGKGDCALHSCDPEAAAQPKYTAPAAGSLQSNPEHIFVNVPAQVYGPGASGMGQAHTLNSLFRFQNDGRTMQSPEAPGCPHKTHVLVSSYGLCPPFDNLRDSKNPLVQMAESGVQVTAINHWKAEGSAEEAEALAEALGVFPPSLLTRIGSFRVRKNFDLVHPPFQQHKKQGERLMPDLPHPSSLPREHRVYGCMHTKLIMVRWSDGTLRVSISSGNLGTGEWSFMAEVGHVQTFSASQSGGQAMGGVSRAPDAAPCEAATGLGGASAPSPLLTTLFLTPSSGVAGDMLRSMLLSMQVSRGTIDALLTGINFNELSAGELVIAQPGFHYRMPKETPAAVSSAPSPLSTVGKKRGAKTEAVAASSHRDCDDVVFGEAAGTGLDRGPVPSKRARFGELPRVEEPFLACTQRSFGADASATAPIIPAPLDRKRLTLLALLSAENFDLGRVGCYGHIALRALQRYGRFAVAALVNATLPWSPLQRGDKPVSRDSLVTERVEMLIPVDGLLVQGSSMGGLQAATYLDWLASANGMSAKAQLPQAITMAVEGDFAPLDLDGVRPAYSAQLPFAVVWPEQRAALRSTVVEALGNLCWHVGGRKAHKAKMPRLHHYQGASGREGLMPHAKMWLPFQLTGGAVAHHTFPPLSTAPLRRHRRWVLVGSANASAAAWGRGGNDPTKPTVISNWEASFLLPTVYALELPRAVAARAVWGASCLRNGTEPAGLSPEERELADVLCCFRISHVAPEQHVPPMRLPPQPYGVGDTPWRGKVAAGRAYHEAVVRSCREAGIGASGGADLEDGGCEPTLAPGAGHALGGSGGHRLLAGAACGVSAFDNDRAAVAAAWEDDQMQWAVADGRTSSVAATGCLQSVAEAEAAAAVQPFSARDQAIMMDESLAMSDYAGEHETGAELQFTSLMAYPEVCDLTGDGESSSDGDS